MTRSVTRVALLYNRSFLVVSVRPDPKASCKSASGQVHRANASRCSRTPAAAAGLFKPFPAECAVAARVPMPCQRFRRMTGRCSNPARRLGRRRSSTPGQHPSFLARILQCRAQRRVSFNRNCDYSGIRCDAVALRVAVLHAEVPP